MHLTVNKLLNAVIKHCHVILHSETWFLGMHLCKTVLGSNYTKSFSDFCSDISEWLKQYFTWCANELVQLSSHMIYCASRNLISRCVSIIVYVHAFLPVCFASFEHIYVLFFNVHFKILCASWLFQISHKNMWMAT